MNKPDPNPGIFNGRHHTLQALRWVCLALTAVTHPNLRSRAHPCLTSQMVSTVILRPHLRATCQPMPRKIIHKKLQQNHLQPNMPGCRLRRRLSWISWWLLSRWVPCHGGPCPSGCRVLDDSSRRGYQLQTSHSADCPRPYCVSASFPVATIVYPSYCTNVAESSSLS